MSRTIDKGAARKRLEDKREAEQRKRELERQEAVSGENLANLYGHQHSALRLNEQEFRFTAIRPREGNIDIGPLVQSAEWRDEGNEFNVNAIAVLRGTITMTKPPGDQLGARLHFNEGHRIRCDVRWGGTWMHLWEMRVYKPVVSLDDNTWTLELADDLQLATLSNDTFKYKAGKVKRKNGWTYDEIVYEVCRQYRIPLGVMVKGRHRIKHLTDVDHVSPLECIRRAVEEESKFTGRRLVIRWRYSQRLRRYSMTITEATRNPLLYELEEQIMGASIEYVRNAKLCTALTARATQKKEKKRGKKRGSEAKEKKKKVLKATFYADGKDGFPDAMSQYGFIHKTVSFPGIESLEDLKRAAKRHFVKVLEVQKKIELTHPGIAFIRRGDGLQLTIPDEGIQGKAGIMFITSVSHSLAGGTYTMSLTLTVRDPLDPKVLRAERDAAIKRQKQAAGKGKAKNRKKNQG